MQLVRPPHSCPCWRLSRLRVSDCKREFLKQLEWLFGFFRLPRGLLRKTRHWRRKAGAQHGTAGARHSMWISLSGALSQRRCGWRNGLQIWRIAADILNK
jgi:hypothetical protein